MQQEFYYVKKNGWEGRWSGERQARVLQFKKNIPYNKKAKRKHKSIPRDKSDRRTLDTDDTNRRDGGGRKEGRREGGKGKEAGMQMLLYIY